MGNKVDEVANKIYARLAQAAQHSEGQKEGCSFMEFRKQNPPTFAGETDPMVAENWLLKMEKLLKVLHLLTPKRWSMPPLPLKALLRDDGLVLRFY